MATSNHIIEAQSPNIVTAVSLAVLSLKRARGSQAVYLGTGMTTLITTPSHACASPPPRRLEPVSLEPLRHSRLVYIFLVRGDYIAAS